MGGWKTKLGGILLGLSQAVPIFGLSGQWATGATHVCVGLGTLFTAWGLGHKIEKAAKAVADSVS